jgi:diaminohydroxyphosphoribosylaminopyrimidine deaminase/5-amino-6-(5-phosphoribosylamino)uracil reductase
LNHRVFRDGHADRTIVAVTRDCPEERRTAFEGTGATVWQVRGTSAGRVGVRPLLRRAGREGMLHLLCEGGAELAGSLVRSHAVDRFVFFVAPRFIGGHGVPAIGSRGWRMGRLPELSIVDIRRSGKDVRIDAVPGDSSVSNRRS